MGRAFITTVSILGALAFNAASPVPAAAQSYADDPAYAHHERLSPRALEALLAPVALYPDQLLSQILMAATYPYDVEEASDWVARATNASLRGDALTFALEPWEWDPSVKTLAQFPDVLRMMSDEYDWTVRVGNAFLLQERDVMDAIQRLRHQAFGAGELRSNQYQRVYFDGGAVVIDMIDPGTVYIPRYDPIRAYGMWAYPDYQPYYFRRPVIVHRYVVVPTLWGWSSWDWRGHRIRVDIPRYRHFNRQREWYGRDDTWRHDGRRRDANFRRDGRWEGDRERGPDRNWRENGPRANDRRDNDWRGNPPSGGRPDWDRDRRDGGERAARDDRRDDRRQFQNPAPPQVIAPPADGARGGRPDRQWDRRQERADRTPQAGEPAGQPDSQNGNRRGFRDEGGQSGQLENRAPDGQRRFRSQEGRPEGGRERGNRQERQAYAGPQLTPPAPVAAMPPMNREPQRENPRAVLRGNDGPARPAFDRRGGGEARGDSGGGGNGGEGERRGRNRGDRD